MTDADIIEAMETPPQTRARLRGEFIRKAKRRKRSSPSTGCT
ncbi:MAG: hypothetical protein R2789_07920 [Microthrixaceae bacterium]